MGLKDGHEYKCHACGKSVLHFSNRLTRHAQVCPVKPSTDEGVQAALSTMKICHRCPQTDCGAYFYYAHDLARHYEALPTHTLTIIDSSLFIPKLAYRNGLPVWPKSLYFEAQFSPFFDETSPHYLKLERGDEDYSEKPCCGLFATFDKTRPPSRGSSPAPRTPSTPAGPPARRLRSRSQKPPQAQSANFGRRGTANRAASSTPGKATPRSSLRYSPTTPDSPTAAKTATGRKATTPHQGQRKGTGPKATPGTGNVGDGKDPKVGHGTKKEGMAARNDAKAQSPTPDFPPAAKSAIASKAGSPPKGKGKKGDGTAGQLVKGPKAGPATKRKVGQEAGRELGKGEAGAAVGFGPVGPPPADDEGRRVWLHAIRRAMDDGAPWTRDLNNDERTVLKAIAAQVYEFIAKELQSIFHMTVHM